MSKRKDYDKFVSAGTSESHQCFNSEMTNLTDDEDFDDTSAFHSTKVIPVRNRNINRGNVPISNVSNNEKMDDGKIISISDDDDDDEKMETTDDDNSFSPPTLAKSIHQQQMMKKSSIMNAIMPQKLFKLTSGVGVINPNISKLNAIDDLSSKKCSNNVDSVIDDNVGQSNSTTSKSVITVNAGTLKLPPKRYFRWGLENKVDGPKASGQYRKNSIQNFVIRRNNNYKTPVADNDDDDDDNSETLDSISCNSTESSDREEKISRPIVTMTHKLMIAGVNVEFPLKPYPSQVAVMNAVSTR